MFAMVCGLLIVLLIVLLVDDYADIAGAWAVVSQSVFSVGDVTLSNSTSDDLYIWNIYWCKMIKSWWKTVSSLQPNPVCKSSIRVVTARPRTTLCRLNIRQRVLNEMKMGNMCWLCPQAHDESGVRDWPPRVTGFVLSHGACSASLRASVRQCCFIRPCVFWFPVAVICSWCSLCATHWKKQKKKESKRKVIQIIYFDRNYIWNT